MVPEEAIKLRVLVYPCIHVSLNIYCATYANTWFLSTKAARKLWADQTGKEHRVALGSP